MTKDSKASLYTSQTHQETITSISFPGGIFEVSKSMKQRQKQLNNIFLNKNKPSIYRENSNLESTSREKRA